MAIWTSVPCSTANSERQLDEDLSTVPIEFRESIRMNRSLGREYDKWKVYGKSKIANMPLTSEFDPLLFMPAAL